MTLFRQPFIQVFPEKWSAAMSVISWPVISDILACKLSASDPLTRQWSSDMSAIGNLLIFWSVIYCSVKVILTSHLLTSEWFANQWSSGQWSSDQSSANQWSSDLSAMGNLLISWPVIYIVLLCQRYLDWFANQWSSDQRSANQWSCKLSLISWPVSYLLIIDLMVRISFFVIAKDRSYSFINT